MRNLIQQIHILKNKLTLSDEIYRAMLSDNYGVNSSKDLNLSQQKELIHFLNNKISSFQQRNRLSVKQENYILFLSKDTISNLPAFCSKIVKRTIYKIQELKKQEAVTVINSLKRYHKGVHKKESSHETTTVY